MPTVVSRDTKGQSFLHLLQVSKRGSVRCVARNLSRLNCSFLLIAFPNFAAAKELGMYLPNISVSHVKDFLYLTELLRKYFFLF